MTDLSKMTMEELIDEICDHIKESCVECTYDHALAQQELTDRITLLEAVREAAQEFVNDGPTFRPWFEKSYMKLKKAVTALKETKEQL